MGFQRGVTPLPLLLLAAGRLLLGAGGSPTCPGSFDIAGHGRVSLVPTGWPKGGSDVEVTDQGAVVPHMSGRAYFSESCSAGLYDNKQYLGLPLLGKTFRYTTDMSNSGCGCNAALYLVSMRQNTDPSKCHDFYCDANKVCGVNCAEIDIQEANAYAWHSTLHTSQDKSGVGKGFGGGGRGWSGPRDFTARQYAPGAECVDTSQPFEVEVSFPLDASGHLKAMQVTLSQEGHSCPLTMSLDTYKGMAELHDALAAGMTPVVSYWSDDDMLWLDGVGKDMQGPCVQDSTKFCTEKVRFYDFSIEDMPDQPAPVPSSTGTSAGASAVAGLPAAGSTPLAPRGPADFTRSGKGVYCRWNQDRILRSFQALSAGSADSEAARNECEGFCSMSMACWGCSIQCGAGGSCLWNAIPACGGLVDHVGRIPGDVSRKPMPEAPYHQLQYGAESCPPGTEITSQEECERAVKSLGWSSVRHAPGAVGARPHFPRLCSVTKHLHGGQCMAFNSGMEGKAHKGVAPVCKTVGDQVGGAKSLKPTSAVSGGAAPSATCPGSFEVAGQGSVSLVNAKWNVPGDKAGKVKVEDGSKLAPYMKGRSYFADTCTEGSFSNEHYVAWKLLGKTLTYTTDMSGAGCGCNAAFYLVSMRQNDKPSGCSDHYCDANNVCGVSCAEIDLQEANQHAWHSTLHTATDHGGVGGGYGGGSGWNGPRDFSAQQYGIGAKCIDTSKPFQVAVSFPVDGQGTLQAMVVKLTQSGSSCPLTVRIGNYKGNAELTRALAAGMTPVMSYWSANDMLWMDGKGSDGQGPCGKDNAAACSDSVRFYDFSVADIGKAAPTLAPAEPQAPMQELSDRCSAEGEDCTQTHCCSTPGHQCFGKNRWWAVCLQDCTPGVNYAEQEQYRTPWACEPLGERRGAVPDFADVILRLKGALPRDWKQGTRVALVDHDGHSFGGKLTAIPPKGKHALNGTYGTYRTHAASTFLAGEPEAGMADAASRVMTFFGLCGLVVLVVGVAWVRKMGADEVAGTLRMATSRAAELAGNMGRQAFARLGGPQAALANGPSAGTAKVAATVAPRGAMSPMQQSPTQWPLIC